MASDDLSLYLHICMGSSIQIEIGIAIGIEMSTEAMNGGATERSTGEGVGSGPRIGNGSIPIAIATPIGGHGPGPAYKHLHWTPSCLNSGGR